MEDRVARLEAKVEALSVALARVEARLAALDGAPRDEGVAVAPAAAGGGVPEAAAIEEPFYSRVVPIIGRTFVMLGGAWLLRALTEAGTLPSTAGVALGLVYAGAIFVCADRAAARGRPTSAEVLGLTGSIVAFPLVFEAVTRLSMMATGTAVVLLAALFAFSLTIAWKRSLRGMAWAVTLGTLAVTVALIVTTRRLEPTTTLLVAVGVTTVWLSYERHWFGVRWLAAGVADMFVLVMVDLASRPEGPPDIYRGLSAPAAQAIAVGLLVAYLATFAVRTLVRSRNVNVFEVVQTLAAVAVGIGGAAGIARGAGVGRVGLGWAVLIAAAACYAVAFAFLDRRSGTRVNLLFYATLGLVLAISGTVLVAAAGPRVAAWCALGIAAAALGGHWDRTTLRWQSVAYLVVASAAAGAAASTHRAFLGALAPDATVPGMGEWMVLAASLAAYAALAATSRRVAANWVLRLPHLAVATVALATVGAVVVFMAWRLMSAPHAEADLAVLATIRTGVLSLSALALAFAGRRLGTAELNWLSIAVLVIGGIKLLFQDLSSGRPATLVLGFVLYGIALIVAPRLLRHERATPA